MCLLDTCVATGKVITTVHVQRVHLRQALASLTWQLHVLLGVLLISVAFEQYCLQVRCLLHGV